MSQICIVALIGLPGAGKSYFSKWLLSQTTQRLRGKIVHYCYDRFLTFNEKTVDFEYKKQRLQIFELLAELVRTLKATGTIPYELQEKLSISGNNESLHTIIICDDNHYYRSMRYKLYQLCRSNEIAFAQIYFKSELKTSMERNNARVAAERIPMDVLEIMARRLEKPQLKNFWEQQTLTIDCKNLNFDLNLINEFLSDSLNNIPKHLKEKKEVAIQSQSAVHEVDLLLRKKISEILGSVANPDEKRLRALALNAKRQGVLQAIRESKDQAFEVEDFIAHYNSFI